MSKPPIPELQEAPYPPDYESAVKEIRKLRRQLQRQNDKMANMAERYELVKRSLMGQIKALQNGH